MMNQPFYQPEMFTSCPHTISLKTYLIEFMMDFVEDEGLVVIGSVPANNVVSCKVDVKKYNTISHTNTKTHS